MSVVNIVASLLSPEFPTMYLVHTPDMDKAEVRGGKFGGLVGVLVPLPFNTPHRDKVPTSWSDGQGPWFKWFNRFLVLALVSLPLIIVGIMSGFRIVHKGNRNPDPKTVVVDRRNRRIGSS